MDGQTKCDKDHAVHEVHGQCDNHVGFMHTAKKDGKTFMWADQVLHDGSKNNEK